MSNGNMFENLYARGLYFIPVNPLTKMPAMIADRLMGVSQATRNHEQLLAYLQQGHGLAFVGGKIDLQDDKTNPMFVLGIDVDVKREDGFNTIAKLEEDYGKLPPTLSIRTQTVNGAGQRGKHFYFLSRTQIGSNNDAFRKKLGQPGGVDIKGVNGYCVCPPTEGYEIENDLPLAELPLEWQMLLSSLVASRDHQHGGGNWSQPPRPDIVRSFNSEVSIHSALEGRGYRRVDDNFYCHPFGATSPKNVHIVRNTAELTHGAEFISFHYGAHDRVQGGPHDAFDLMRLLDYDGDWDATIQSQVHRGDQTTDEDLNTCFLAGTSVRRPLEEFIADHAREEDVAILAGHSETLKTFAAIDAAFSLATNLPFLERFPVRHGIQSCLILTESKGDFYDRRLAWLKRRAEVSGRSIEELQKLLNNVLVYFSPLILTDPKSEEKFKQHLQKNYPNFRPRFWVLDHISNNTTGDENSNTEMARLARIFLKKVRDEHSCLWALHHPPKDSSSKTRGGGALVNNLPLCYSFDRKDRKKDNPVVVSQYKDSYRNGFQSYELEVHFQKLYFDTSKVIPQDRYGIAVSARAIAEAEVKIPADQRETRILHELGNYWLTTKDLMQRLDLSKPIILDIMESMVKRGLVQQQGTKSKGYSWAKLVKST